MKVFTLIGFVFCLALSGFSQDHSEQKLSKDIKKIIAEMSATNVFEATATVGYAGVPSPQLARYNTLLKKCTPYQLLQIANTDTNAVVRLYAFKALNARMDSIPAEIAMQFKNDSTIILYQTGDIVKEQMVKSVANGFLK